MKNNKSQVNEFLRLEIEYSNHLQKPPQDTIEAQLVSHRLSDSYKERLNEAWDICSPATHEEILRLSPFKADGIGYFRKV